MRAGAADRGDIEPGIRRDAARQRAGEDTPTGMRRRAQGPAVPPVRERVSPEPVQPLPRQARARRAQAPGRPALGRGLGRVLSLFGENGNRGVDRDRLGSVGNQDL